MWITLFEIICDFYWRIYKNIIPDHYGCKDYSHELFGSLTWFGKFLYLLRPLMLRPRKSKNKTHNVNVNVNVKALIFKHHLCRLPGREGIGDPRFLGLPPEPSMFLRRGNYVKENKANMVYSGRKYIQKVPHLAGTFDVSLTLSKIC